MSGRCLTSGITSWKLAAANATRSDAASAFECGASDFSLARYRPEISAAASCCRQPSNLDLTNDGVDSAANGTTDFNYASNDGETQVFIKKAYVQAKLSDSLFARLGSADLPWVPMVEDLYGYRWVESVIIDRLKFGTSADWGVHAGGKFGDGLVNYAVSAVNGAGYKNPTRSSTMDFEARVGFMPLKELTIF